MRRPRRPARGRQGEIEALTAAATQYQADNGSYPRVSTAIDGTNNTDKLDAQTRYDPSDTVTPTYSTTSKWLLYQLLSGAYYVDTNGKPEHLDRGRNGS